MALDPQQILFIGNFFADDPDTSVADADPLLGSLFVDVFGPPNIGDEFIPSTGPAAAAPPVAPETRLYDLLPNVVRVLDEDGALEAVLDSVDDVAVDIRDDIFKITQILDPFQAPAAVLPHLAATFDIKDFDASTNPMLLRQQIATAVASYRQKGTIGGIQLALLFLGYQSEVVELYESYSDIAPSYASLGGKHRLSATGRRPNSDILILVRPILRGLAFTQAERTRIRTRLTNIIPLHVEITELGRFESPQDGITVSDQLALNLQGDIQDGMAIDDFFVVTIFFSLADGGAFADALEVYQSGGGSDFAWDVSGTGWDQSGVGWDGGKTLARSV